MTYYLTLDDYGNVLPHRLVLYLLWMQRLWFVSRDNYKRSLLLKEALSCYMQS